MRIATRTSAPLARSSSRLRHRARRAVEILRHEGTASLLLRVAALAGYRRALLFSSSLSPSLSPAETDLPLEYGFLQPEEIELFHAYRPDVGADGAARRLRQGERCFVARLDDRIVSARWIMTGRVRVPEFRLTLPLAPDAVFVYDSYTSPDVRGRRVASATSTRLSAILAAEGWTNMLATVLPENGAGIKNATRSGLREVGRLAVLVIGPLPALRVPYFGRRRYPYS